MMWIEWAMVAATWIGTATFGVMFVEELRR
jgi:hypothetical protein